MSNLLLSFFVLSAFIFCFFSASPVHAAGIVISDAAPETIASAEQEYQATITLSINASDGTKYYLGGVFSMQGSTNYCGKTWSQETSSWTIYTDETNLPAVTVASSSASLVLKTRLDTEDSGCQSAGTYVFKVRRYTEGGSASFDEQNEQTVNVALPTFTPTPTRTPAPTPTSKPEPSHTPAPTAKPTAFPTVILKTLTPAKIATAKPSNQPEILGQIDRNEATVSDDHISTKSGTRSGKTQGIIVGLVASGGVCIGSAGYLMLRKKQ